eukprot:5883852-Amphidinium_carterae.1
MHNFTFAPVMITTVAPSLWAACAIGSKPLSLDRMMKFRLGPPLCMSSSASCREAQSTAD